MKLSIDLTGRGRGRDRAWEQAAREIGGEFRKGSFLESPRITVWIKHWTVTMDRYSSSGGGKGGSTTYTIMRAPFVSSGSLRFSIYRKRLLSGLFKKLGMQDIVVGFPEFDDEFIVKSSNETMIRQLLMDSELRKCIQEQPSLNLSLLDGRAKFIRGPLRNFLPENVDELYFDARGIVREVERIKSLFHLFGATLYALSRIGVAIEADPGEIRS